MILIRTTSSGESLFPYERSQISRNVIKLFTNVSTGARKNRSGKNVAMTMVIRSVFESIFTTFGLVSGPPTIVRNKIFEMVAVVLLSTVTKTSGNCRLQTAVILGPHLTKSLSKSLDGAIPRSFAPIVKTNRTNTVIVARIKDRTPPCASTNHKIVPYV